VYKRHLLYFVQVTTVSNLFAILEYSSDLIIAAQRYFVVKIYSIN